jgi:N,N'-diacetylchitobiose phosphorylase
MQYGHFDDDAREYVVTNPDTPQPWTNYLGSLEYGAIITNNAGGYSFVKSAALGRILRCRFNAIPVNEPGRFIYLHDHDSHDFWSASWQPVAKDLASYVSTCRHGTGYTIISSEYDGIRTETSYYVPRGARHEVWAFAVTNKGPRPRELSIFNYAELTNDNNESQDMVNLQYTQYISRTYYKGNMVLQSINENQSEVGATASFQGTGNVGGPGIYRFVGVVGADACGYDGSRESFVGANRTYARPAAVEKGQCGNSLNYTKNATGSMQVRLKLAPGETRSLVYVLGPGGEVDGRAAMARYERPGTVEKEIADVKRYWHDRLGALQVTTPDRNFNLMVNTWNAYQNLITFAWSRSASMVYFAGRNGYGYRDTLQDLTGVTHLIPTEIGERLRIMLSGQVSTGGGLPLVTFDHRPGTALDPEDPRNTEFIGYRCDDALWLFPSVDLYIKETGDAAFLDQVVPYADKGEDTVMGHLRRALDFSVKRSGKHGLVLGLLADWNDCLRMGKNGESVFASFQLYLGLSIYAGLAKLKNLSAESAWALGQQKVLGDSIQKHVWEKDRFVRGFSGGDGYVLGSQNNEEGRIFLNAQSWAVVSGLARNEQGRTAMDSACKDLNTPYGLMICYPAFRKYGLPVVRAILCLPGIKENGGVFSHCQGWAILAETQLGRGNRAFEFYNNVNPARLNDGIEVRESEPYVHCQFTEGVDSPFHGRAQNPWLTGTATTVQTSAVQGILGVRPEIDGLRIDPCIPSAWDGFTMRRVFRGKVLNVTVKNLDHIEHGVAGVTLNGKALPDNLIPLSMMKDANDVVVVMGRKA